jgi:hypothetical protein
MTAPQSSPFQYITVFLVDQEVGAVALQAVIRVWEAMEQQVKDIRVAPLIQANIRKVVLVKVEEEVQDR